MSNIIILCWQPGSCGDFVQRELLSDTDNYSGVVKNFIVTDNGRTLPKIDLFFKQAFEHPPEQWYNRSWSTADCELLYNYVNTLKCKNFIIPTHRFDQLPILQKSIPGSKTMGITYPKNMFPLVLKNWCKKVAPQDTQINKIYNQPIHKLMKNKNTFGEFVLIEQLRHGTNIQPAVNSMFDINLSLEDLFCRDGLKWLDTQNQLHQYQCDLQPTLKQALGYNSKATLPAAEDLLLDTFDNILIKEHCSEVKVPVFKFLSEANAFFSILGDKR
jgi:hypothetical protein